MDIILHWHNDHTKFMRTGENSLSYKHRLGHHSAILDSRLNINGLSNTINKKWKINLTERLKRLKFYSDVECTVFIGSTKFTLAGIKTPEKWANNLANLLLQTRHMYKDAYGKKREDILQSL